MALQRGYCNAQPATPTCENQAFGLKWVALPLPLHVLLAPPNCVSVAQARRRRALTPYPAIFGEFQ